MRKILIGVAVLIVVIAGAVYFLWSNLDSLVKTAIEEVGTKVAGVTVKVDTVHISLTKGTGTISGLTVANPPGFKAPAAISLGSVSVAIDTGSVTGNPVVIKTVTVAAPAVTYELGQNGSNIAVIQHNVQSFAAKKGNGGGKTTTAGGSANAGSGKKLVIDRLVMTGGKVTLATPVPGAKASVDLPPIRLSNIGRAGGGATPAVVAETILQALSTSAVNASANLGVGKVLDNLKTTSPSSAVNAIKGLLGK